MLDKPVSYLQLLFKVHCIQKFALRELKLIVSNIAMRSSEPFSIRQGTFNSLPK